MTEKGSSRGHYPEAETLLTQTQKLLGRSGLRARKGLGQHFLIDEEALALIVSTARLSAADTVVEVGPGLGVLTKELARRAGRVIAVELDSKLAGILEESLSAFGNVSIIYQDVLKVVPETLVSGEDGESGSSGYKVVANLPYYITSPGLRHFLESSTKPQLMVVMVQKEVAEEVVAKPGRMSLLSIGIQLYGAPEIAGYVAASSFYPTPEVDSAILKVVPHPQPLVGPGDRESFFTLVRAGFSASRKQLANSLAQGLGISKTETLALLARAEITPQRRAETLSIEEWEHLRRIYSEGED